ncbi:MAG TPA: tRNA uridine-5-carboxymethylaminomethyl(34) synthesis GTPase MnmE [Allosphingosinicella sp.]
MRPEGRDTIYALSSGSPPAAVAIVRISGPEAADAVRALAGRMPEPRVATLAFLRHPVAGEVIDQALVLFFPAPKSATGDDVAELHLHGGRSIVAGVLAALGEVPGLREAQAGEFTRRAFENGRIDLTEAEGLADLLMAETDSQRRAALALAGGALSRTVAKWQEELLAVSGQLEAVLDFSDEGDVGEEPSLAESAALEKLILEMEAALQRPSSERLRDGLRVVIAGPPNTGKSSLLNWLAGRRAAITSAVAGTTRDVVEAPTAIGGSPFLLIDTAGLRESLDEVEAIGIQRAQANLEAADLILWLGDPGACPDPDRAIIVRSMADLHPSPPEPNVDISVSAETGQGMSELVALLIARSRALLPQEGEVAINARHRRAIGNCLDHLHEAQSSRDVIIASEALRLARAELDRVTGQAGVEDMLDSLFGSFCIGK